MTYVEELGSIIRNNVDYHECYELNIREDKSAEAVVARVLNDLKSALGGFTGGYEHGEEIDLGQEIDAFAADCDINLEDNP